MILDSTRGNNEYIYTEKRSVVNWNTIPSKGNRTGEMRNERNRSRLTGLENGGQGERTARSNLGISMNVQMYTYVLLREIDSAT